MIAGVFAALMLMWGAPPPMSAASDGSNVWFVTQRVGKGGVEHVLFHHGEQMNGAYASELRTFEIAPSALAASNGTLWLVMPAVDAVRDHAEVYRASAQIHPPTGMYRYFPEPLTSLPSLVEALPAACTVGGAATDGNDLFVVCAPGIPSRLAPTGWERAEGAPAVHALMQWGRRPAGVVSTSPLVLSVEGTPWEQLEIQLPPNAQVFSVSGSPRAAVVVQTPGEPARLCYINGTALAPLAQLPHTDNRWAVVGMGDAFLYLEAAGDGAVAMRRIDGVDGTVGEAMVATRPPSPVGNWVHWPVLAMLLIAVALMAALVHQVGPAGRQPAPYGFEALPFARRLTALAIDLVPAVGALIAMGYPVKQLFVIPLVSASTSQAVPGTLLVLFTMAYCVLLEAATGTTLGKRVVGGRTARMVPPGNRPAVWQVLVRNLFKGMVMLVPPAAVFVAWSPGGRGVGDVLAGTAVIRRNASPPLKPEQGSRR